MNEELKIIFPIITALIGAIIGAWINNNLQSKRILNEQKAQLLKDLMATRFDSPQDQKAAEAINYLPVLFGKNTEVIEAYNQYRAVMEGPLDDCSKEFKNLVTVIANSIGINATPSLDKSPIFSKKRLMEDVQVTKDWAHYKQESIATGTR